MQLLSAATEFLVYMCAYAHIHGDEEACESKVKIKSHIHETFLLCSVLVSIS